jgi:hypothetical protein
MRDIRRFLRAAAVPAMGLVAASAATLALLLIALE